MNAPGMLFGASAPALSVLAHPAGFVSERDAAGVSALIGPLIQSLAYVSAKHVGEELGEGPQKLSRQHPLRGRVVDVLGDGDESDVVHAQVGQRLQGDPEVAGPSVKGNGLRRYRIDPSWRPPSVGGR